MKYAFNSNGEMGQLNIGGRLTFAEAPQFPKILAEISAAKSMSRLEIRLGDLNFIDSTGMSLFVHIYDASQGRGLNVSVSGATGAVSAALERADFKTLFEFK